MHHSFHLPYGKSCPVEMSWLLYTFLLSCCRAEVMEVKEHVRMFKMKDICLLLRNVKLPKLGVGVGGWRWEGGPKR